jgi:hypothetical protein
MYIGVVDVILCICQVFEAEIAFSHRFCLLRTGLHRDAQPIRGASGCSNFFPTMHRSN